jgi:ABC-2 type transport system permease protein
MTFVQTARIAWGIAKRSLMLIPRVPSTFFPSLVMPLFLTITFAGAFSGLTMIPGFPAAKAIDWFIPMTVVQGSAFAGITIGLGVARDLESGFYDRLLLSPAPRSALVAGPLIAGVLRSTFPLTLLLITAFLADANLPGGALGIVTLAAASLGIGLIGGAWSLGLSLRFKTMQAAPLMQMGVFLSVFLSTAQMPLHLISGWLHDVARVNPMTNVLALAREGFLGEVTWSGTWPGLVSLAAISLALVLFAARGMQRISP